MPKLLRRKLGLFLVLWVLSKFFRVKRIESQEEKEIFTKMWYRAWLKEGYAKPGEPVVAKYAKYNRFSVDLLAKFLGILPVGTLRIIRNNGEVGLPVLNDFEIARVWDDREVMEVTLFTIVKRFRGFFNLASLALMKTMYQYAKKEEVDGIIVAADRRFFHLLIRRFGFPFHQIGREKMYEGSLTHPLYLNFEEAEKIARERSPDLYRFFAT